MEQLVATIKGYDPNYTDKVKLLVEAIEHGLSTRKQFSFADVNRHLDFDCNRYIRLLGRLGFLISETQRTAWSITQFIAGRRPAHRTTSCTYERAMASARQHAPPVDQAASTRLFSSRNLSRDDLRMLSPVWSCANWRNDSDSIRKDRW